jgi:putative SOS response-associated peptidase YedK
MCGRTSLFVPPDVLEERFDADLAVEYQPRYNIAPREQLATVRDDEPDAIGHQEWGLLAPWAEDPDDGPRPINARLETVTEKSMFREPVAERRCLVLADGFYEWAGERGAKQPYRVHLADDRPFAMAGCWNRWESDDDVLETVTILTTEANDVVAPIHDRMPVVLEPATESIWLEGTLETALSVCGPYGGDDMCTYEVSRAVNFPENDRPAVVEPASETQSGLEDFGA